MKNETEAIKLGRNLKRLRTEKGFTQANVSKAVGIACPYLSNIENGKINPTLPTLIKLAKALQVSVDEIVG